jgi:hypothetical protein
VHPTRPSERFNQLADCDPTKVVDDYIELRLSYRSVYAEELRLPDLSGKLTKGYRVSWAKKRLEPA